MVITFLGIFGIKINYVQSKAIMFLTKGRFLECQLNFLGQIKCLLSKFILLKYS